MENTKSKGKASVVMFVLSILFKVLFAISFLLMPAASSFSLNEGKTGFLYAVGILFWATLILSQVMMLFVTVKRKKYFLNNKPEKLPKYPSIITFFYTKEATVADVIMMVAIVAFAITVALTDSYFIYVFLFLSALMIQAHCVLNGKNLIYIKELKQGAKRNENQT